MKGLKKKSEEEEQLQDIKEAVQQSGQQAEENIRAQLAQFQEQAILSDDKAFRFYLIHTIAGITKSLEAMNATIEKVGRLIESRSPSLTEQEEDQEED